MIADAVSVRVAREDDETEIARLTVQLGYDVTAAFVRRRLAELLARPDHRFLVAAAADRLTGWVHAHVIDYVETEPFVAIGGLVVDRDARQQGVGRRLLAEAEQWAVERGCAVVRLSSSVTRHAAHRFYERLGYTNIKTQYAFAKRIAGGDADDLRRFVPRVD